MPADRAEDRDRDRRIATAAALAAHRLWLDEAERAYLAGPPQPICDQVSLEHLAMCAQWVIEDATGVPYQPQVMDARLT